MQTSENACPFLHQHTICYLDLTFSSKLLSLKIADVPQKLKYEMIIKPLLEYCFGTCNADEFRYDHKNSDKSYELSIDWIRDKTCIYDHVFDLDIDSFVDFTTRFNLWENKQFMLASLKNYTSTLLFGLFESEIKHDREIVMAAVQENPFNIEYADLSYRSDFEIMKMAVQVSGYALKFASAELRNNKEIVMLAVGRDAAALQYVTSTELRNDREIVKIAIQDKQCSALSFLSDEWRNNKEIVLLALECNPENYKHVSANLKYDKDVICKVLSKFKDPILFERLGNDRESFMRFASIDGLKALEYASKELKNDREIVTRAVQQNPKALCFASNELKQDREIVKMAVMKDGNCLQYASVELRDDKEIVELALRSRPDSLNYISRRLRSDFDFISRLIGKRGFTNIPFEFRLDKEVSLESIKINRNNFHLTHWKNDRDFILRAVSMNGTVFLFLKEEFTQDREIALAAVTQNGNIIDYLSKPLLEDKEIILKAAENCIELNEYFRNVSDREIIEVLIKRFGGLLTYLPRKFQLDREIVMEAVKTNPKAVFSIDGASARLLTKDRVIAMRAVKVDGMVLGQMCYNHRNDREIVSFAAKQNKDALKFASFALRIDKEILASLWNNHHIHNFEMKMKF